MPYLAGRQLSYPVMTPPTPPAYCYQWQPLPQVIQTETRRIIIKRLAHTADEDSLWYFLRAVLPLECGNIQNIKIAKYGNDEPKGHAFATFPSFSAAQLAITTLDGYKYKGRTLSVSIAKEVIVSSKRHAHTPRARGSATRRSMTSSTTASDSGKSSIVPRGSSSSTGFPDISERSMLGGPVMQPPKPSNTPAVVDGTCWKI